MYSDKMRIAFNSLRDHCPKGFGVDIIDEESFLVLRLDSLGLSKLDDHNKRKAVEYAVRVKAALEDQGAVVLVTRTPLGDYNGPI